MGTHGAESDLYRQSPYYVIHTARMTLASCFMLLSVVGGLTLAGSALI